MERSIHSGSPIYQQGMFTDWHALSGELEVPDLGFLAPLKPTIVFQTYWYFAAERQAVFFRRLKGKLPPWTKDPVLQNYKFTNAYRASDRVSQFLIRNVIYKGSDAPEEVFFRTLLFKLFNRIGTWKLLQEAVGEISYKDFSFSAYDTSLTKAINAGQRIYSAAYIMPSGGRASEYKRKHQMHLKLLEQMMSDGLPKKVQRAHSMKEVFELLLSYPTIGDFLAYQFATDLNYSRLTNFDEMAFVVPGPGARDGLRKCFSDLGGLKEAEAIKLITQHQKECFAALGITFPSLWGRPLQLIDCQNLFCEVDKYARVVHPEFSGRTGRLRIKQKFRPITEPVSYWYPPKWEINDFIVGGAPDV